MGSAVSNDDDMAARDLDLHLRHKAVLNLVEENNVISVSAERPHLNFDRPRVSLGSVVRSAMMMTWRPENFFPSSGTRRVYIC